MIAASFKDMVKQRFGRLIVLNRAENNDRGDARWNCKCDCGRTCTVLGSNLRKKNGTKSCGCVQKEWVATNKPHTIHGLAHLPEFKIWIDIKKRCKESNRDNKKHYLYAGRGIKICDRWKESFKYFYEDMGARPTDQHSIERKDNNGNYEPNNCYWATDKEQANNKRTNILITWDGKTQTLSQWAEELGFRYSTLRDRYYSNWGVERMLTTPTGSRS